MSLRIFFSDPSGGRTSITRVRRGRIIATSRHVSALFHQAHSNLAARASYDRADALLTPRPLAGRPETRERAESDRESNPSRMRFCSRKTVEARGRGNSSRPNRLGTPRGCREEVSSDITR